MATLSRITVVGTGLTPSYTAADVAGDTFPNLVSSTEKTFFICKNGGGSPITVTIDSQTNCNQGFDHDLAVSVANGSEEWIGPIDKDRFNDSSGNVSVTYSAVTSVTVAVVGVP